MVYVYAKQSELNKYIGKKLSVDQISDALMDMGMDLKGISSDKDPELKIEITSEKLDMVSLVGIARAIRHYLGIAKKLPEYKIAKAKHKVIVKKSVSKVRPKTVAALVTGFSFDEDKLQEIIDLQEKLHDSFGRHRKKAAIGIYPLREVHFPVTYLAERPGKIVFKPLGMGSELNGKEILEEHEKGRAYAHLLDGFSTYPVFRDARGHVLSLPPIINSEETGKVTISDKDFFIEISGHNLAVLDSMLKMLATTFIEMGAGVEAVKVEYEGAENYVLDLKNRTATIDVNFVNKLIGIAISVAQAKKLLEKMMYTVRSVKGSVITVEIPCFRSDVWHDVDIADDIARAYGYNNIAPRFPNISTVGGHLPFSLLRERVAESLVSMGYLELYTYLLSSTRDQFELMGRKADGVKGKYVRLIDSADEGINMCRTLILPEILKSLHINRKNKYPQSVFENGFTLQVDDSVDTGARNEAHVAVAFADPKSNYTIIKGVLDSFARLHELKLSFKEGSAKKYPYFIEGRVAEVVLGKQVVGVVGEIHPFVLSNFGLLVPVSAFELNLEKIWELSK